MSEPLVVTIPHRLGKDEALRRIKDGLGHVQTQFGSLIALEQADWSGDRLSFCARSTLLLKRASSETRNFARSSMRTATASSAPAIRFFWTS